MFRDKVYVLPSRAATTVVVGSPAVTGVRPGAALRALAAIALFCTSLGCDRELDDAELVEQTLASLDIAGRVSQLVLSTASPTPANLDSLSARASVQARPGGFWLEGGEAASIARLTSAVRAPQGIPLLIAADLDQGVGGLSGAGTEVPPVGHLLAIAEDGELDEIARIAGDEATTLGIHVAAIRAPVVAGGFPYSQLSRDNEPEALARLLDEARSANLAVALDLFRAPPGESLLGWDRARFEAFELPLLESAREDAAALVISQAVAPALTGDTLSLHKSRPFYTALRREHGWRSPIIADLRGSPEPTTTAVEAVIAGADMVIVRGDPATVTAALLAAVEGGSLSPARIEAAVRRILILKNARIDPTAAPASPDSVEMVLAASQENGAELSGDLIARLAFRRTGEIVPEAALSLVVWDPEQRARSFVGALGSTRQLVELRGGASLDSTAALLGAALSAAASFVVVGTEASTFQLADSLLLSLPDSVRGRAQVVRVGFGGASVGDAEQPILDVFAWGTARGSQLAAAGMLEPGVAPPEESTYAVAPVLLPTEPDSIGMDATRLARVDRLIEDALEDSVFTAAAVVVGRRGGVALMRGYGSAGPGAGSVDPRATLFDVASLSKVVGTTSAAAKLMESGDIGLDEPIRRYIPEFRGENKEDVTVRHLLSHTGGLPPGLQLYYTASSRGEALRQVIEQPLRRAPGVEAEYSDLGMILLAEVIERVTETPLDRFLSRSVFTPLGLSSTMYLPPLAFRTNTVPSAINTERPFVLQGVVHDGNAFRLGGLTGHAGLFSTAWDVAVFSQMMLNGGAYGAVRVLSEETVAELTRQQPNAGERALGWDTPADRSSAGRFLSSSSFGHTGYTGTSIWIDPLRELFVVLLTNRTFTDASAEDILDLRIGVHEAAVQAISDRTISRRPGSR